MISWYNPVPTNPMGDYGRRPCLALLSLFSLVSSFPQIAERAEGDKILQVKAAEADAEAKYLSGVGVAKQRKAIVDGLRTSIVDFDNKVEGSSTKDIVTLLLVTQYFDTIRDVGSSNNCRTVFIPTSQSMSDDLRNSIMQANASG